MSFDIEKHFTIHDQGPTPGTFMWALEQMKNGHHICLFQGEPKRDSLRYSTDGKRIYAEEFVGKVEGCEHMPDWRIVYDEEWKFTLDDYLSTHWRTLA